MVQAILSGTKTQTRRIVKMPDWIERLGGDLTNAFPDKAFGVTPCLQVPCVHLDGDTSVQRLRNPWKWPEPSRLWVRESHFQPQAKTSKCVEYLDGKKKTVTAGGLVLWSDKSDLEKYVQPDNGFADAIASNRGRKISSIHMPRWASRITLEITDVRAERLNDISEEDAKEEGVEPELYADLRPDGELRDGESIAYRASFHELWDKINGKAHPWDSNPWVWAISFRRVEETK